MSNFIEYKTEVGPLDGKPDKRLFWSIINDYDLPTAICELIDNAIDLWMIAGRKKEMLISITLDTDRQVINISDTAGGVKRENLRMLIAPGASANSADEETIGVFGVGSKRAVVALAENISIKTRHGNHNTYQIDIDPTWLRSDDWQLPYYQTHNITEGTTEISLTSLRKTLNNGIVSSIRDRISETYAWFLEIENCIIEVNGQRVASKDFEAWAFPPAHPPHHLTLTAAVPDGGSVGVDITAGLILDRIADAENYGVYFYCNNRLVSKEVKDREVGYYISSLAGVPHPDASLCRVIVRFRGPAKTMPWNSSKTRIVYSHPIFQVAQSPILDLVSHFSSLSRRLKDAWDKDVFPFMDGAMREIAAKDVHEAKHLRLPPLPKARKKHVESLRALNRKVIEDQPWTLGLVEAVAAVDVMLRQKLETKNRISLILLDSTFEIALKEFVVHQPNLFPGINLQQLFSNRENVIKAVAAQVHIRQQLLDRARHYYQIRNKLIHERATVDPTDEDIANYRKTVQKVLGLLFQLKFGDATPSAQA